MKRSLAETYVEPTDAEWLGKFMTLAIGREDRLANDNLSIRELLQESSDQEDEFLIWWLGHWEDQKDRIIQRMRELGLLERLTQLRAMQEHSAKRAEAMLRRMGERHVDH